MSSTLRNGESRDLNLTASDYITLVAVSGTYTATVVQGNSRGTVLGTNVTGGTYGPYTGGAVIRVVTSASSEVDFDIGASPVIVSDTYVMASTNSVTGGIEISLAGSSTLLGSSHVKVALIGDSITARSFIANNVLPILANSAIAPWNWANAVLGAPFVFTQNLAVSGDNTLGIFSRVGSVPPDVDVCFVMAGINDVIATTASSTIISRIGAGIAALVAAGKIVVISTILPNNALTAPKVAILNDVNTYISTLPVLYSNVFVCDGFAALGGNTTTGAATPTTYLNADNTHPNSAGAQAFGQHASVRAALTAAYAKAIPNYSMYAGYQQALPLYNEFRRSTGGTAGTISAGSGTIADNWRCLQNAGTATFTVDATQPYTAPTDFIGAVNKFPVSPDSYWQIFNITAASASDNPRLRTVASISNTGAAQDGIYAGANVFFEYEIVVTSPVALQEVSAGGEVNFTVGTSPADQPSYGTTFVRAIAGSALDSSSAYTAAPADFHVLWRTPVMRIPENLNTTVAVNLTPFVDMKFGAAGSAVVKIGKPRLYIQNAGGRLN